MILGIETATPICGVGLAEGEHVLAECNFAIKNVHDRVLAETIQFLLRECGVEMKQVEAIAVSAGPGSFTGLRIGMSMAKGLAFASEKPLLTINTLLLQAAAAAGYARAFAQARGLALSALHVRPLLNARRGEFYTAAYAVQAALPEQIEPEQILRTSDFVARQTNMCVLCGNGVAAIRAAGLLAQHPDTLALETHEAPLSGGGVARVGALQYERGGAAAADTVEPFYVQDFITGNTPASVS